jgi:hypothetical protein
MKEFRTTHSFRASTGDNFLEKRMSHTKAALIQLISFCLLATATSSLANHSTTRVEAPTHVVELPVTTNGLDPRNEPSVAVSLKNDQIIVGASKLVEGGGSGTGRGNTRVAYYFSSDGGRTWGNGLLGLETPQKSWGRASDPSVVADLDGTFYLCVLMLDNSSFDSSVYIFKSVDGGRTFLDPVPVITDIGNSSAPKQADKCYITIDTSPTSPFKNTIYAIWTSTEGGGASVLIAHRRPGEAGFSEPKTISHNGDMRGPSITTGPNGELYAAWEGIGNPKVILFNASTDGGNTFLPPDVAPGKDFNMHRFVGSLSDPNASIIIRPVRRINSFPVIDVDRSNGPNRGMIYVAWAESRNGTDSDIFIKRLTPPNGGRPDVSEPIRVNNDEPGAHQFFPWLSVDSANGNVEVAFYDQRDDPGGSLINLYLARSTNGGLSFEENIRVSSIGFDPLIQAGVLGSNANPVGIGDYIALAAVQGKAHMMWTDTRNKQKQEIYYGQIAFDSTPGPPPVSQGDACSNPRIMTSVPFQQNADTRSATSSSDDPVSCSGSRDSNTVWYSITPSINTVYGVDLTSSDYDTVVSVYTGGCAALAPVVCNDNFGNGSTSRSLLTFSARAGVEYLIEVSGKGTGGSLVLSLGKPVITGVEYTSAPDGSDALRITGAGLRDGDALITVNKKGEVTPLTTIIAAADRQDDGTLTSIYATKKKLKKLVKRGKTIVVSIESPAGSGRISNQFVFTR